MKKLIITFCIFFFELSFSQVGIGTTSPQSLFEISSNDDGILIPRVDIMDFSTSAPLTSPIESELVYNDSSTTINGLFLDRYRVETN